jgi:hypothetical protein
MNASLPIPDGRRLWRLSALLLLALVLVTGVSLSMSRPFGQRESEVDGPVLPSIRLVHEMTAAVDEARGLTALHLLRADAADQQVLEARLQASRQKIERRMAASRQRLADDTERGHFQRVRSLLGAYWSAQEQLLAASRRAADEPSNAARARALLAGESQQAFQQLRDALEAWWAYTDELAARAAQTGAEQARIRQGLLGLQMLLAVALAAACAVAWRRAAHAGAGAAAAPGSDGPAIGRLALQAHLLSLDAAVIAARSGVAGQPPEAVGREVRQIADRLEAAAAELQALAGLPGAAPGMGSRRE